MMIESIYSQYFKPGNISTDSRKIKPGDIFIALQGENFNGDAFAAKALENGASAVVVSKSCSLKSENIFHVDDTLIFLQQFARYHRGNIQAKIIGLTGTNGKTTTKELINSILLQKFRVQSTQGNLNNHIGVPLTLLSIQKETQIAIIEMGANHPGEIKDLCEIALPEAGLITNIGKAHLEGFGSYEGVKRTKAELYDYLKKRNGKIYYNAGDNVITSLAGDYQNMIVYNSRDSICKGKIMNTLPSIKFELSVRDFEPVTINSALFGEYNLTNMIAASCIGVDHGLKPEQIKNGIEQYSPDSYRSQIITIGSSKLILDCYNANPTSMKYALKSFSEYAYRKKIVILGGMRELGKYEREEHEELAKVISTLRFDLILLSGAEFKGVKLEKSIYFESLHELKEYLKKINIEDTAVLIKGSRANKLEEAAEILKKI
jgi:UDP-N-acetylmuramoyl-tripeptide--D-alanyl-D-alanine ligase